MLSASAGAKWTMGTTPFDVDTIYHETTGPGVTTTALKLQWQSDGTYSTNVFVSTVDLTNPNVEVRGVQAKDGGFVKETPAAMGVRKDKQGNGQYIAGVNADFFNLTGSPTYTNGVNLVDGVLHYGGAGGGWDTWASYVVVDGAKDIRIQQNVTASKDLIFPNGQSHSYHINGGRWENYLVIYTPDSTSTGTNKWGRECTMKLVSGSIANNDAVFEITSEGVGECDGSEVGNMEVPRDGYVLSGVGDAFHMMKTLKVGDKLTMGSTVKINGKIVNPQQVIGGCSMLVINGKSAPDKYFSAQVIDHFRTSQPRTAVGYNEDRSKMYLVVVDEYTKSQFTTTNEEKKTYGLSNGFFMYRMAQLMENLGCYTAMAFDGGGSSQLYTRGIGMRNAPDGGDYQRPVANGLFAVSTAPVDDRVAAIEVRQKNVKLNAGETFTPTVYAYNKYGVLLNNKVEDFTFTVAPELGSMDGKTFTAGDAAKSTLGVVAVGDIKCAVRILVNGGGEHVSSGDDNAPIMVGQTYESEEPMGVDKDPIFLTEQWHFVNTKYNDGWDGTAPDWSADSIKSKSCPRFATARNGRFYTVDMVTMSIAEIDKDGNLTPLYKLPALDCEHGGVKDYYGCAISSDDAGNFLVGHLFTKPETYTVWTIYSPKTGQAKHFALDRGDCTANGRIDNVGRVIGDLTRDAYVYIAPKATGALESNRAHIIHFQGQGEGKVETVTATSFFDKGLWLAGSGNTNSTCQPKYTTVEEMKGKDLNDTFYWYSKAAGVAQYTCDLFTRENGVDSPNYCLDWNNYSGLNGFDTFTLGGKRYFAVNFAEATENQSGQHIVVMDEQSNKVAEWNNPDYTSTAGFNTITAIPVSETQVNIYVYNCTGSFFVDGVKTGAIAGALLTLTLGEEYTADEAVDVTPSGLDFNSYADGDEFKIFSTESNGAWSGPANFYHGAHPTAFDDHGQLTSILYRGMGTDLNNQANVDAKIQPMVTVRSIDKIGKVLVVNEQFSPTASKFAWPGSGFNGAQPQFSFYMRNEDITNKTDARHYIRVRVVYNAMLRGCHYVQDVKNNKDLNVVKSIYATAEGNWVVPSDDHVLGASNAEQGINFAKWVDETGKDADIPAVPVVYEPLDSDVDEWDAAHHGNGCGADPNGKPAYLMNPERFRVYEFDTYINNPDKSTISVQLNLLDRNASYLIKEIKFTDLGTDEAAATLLGRRQLGWKYYNKEEVSGIEDIVTDETLEGNDLAPVYYNLQGVRVINPENGIYIVRRGDKVTKEYIR